MRIWFDTEFIEDGSTIDLLSIGLVREDGHYYYAEVAGAKRELAGDWVKENVLPHLNGPRTFRYDIAADLIKFCGEKPEFWAYYSDYDWVALCQLFGTMMELPKGWPKFCMDVKQLCVMRGNPRLPKNDGRPHHALDDARWTMKAWEFLQAIPPEGERKIIVRTNADATLDEAFLVNGDANFHIEQMSATHWWMALCLDKQRIDINLHSRATIKANVSDEGEVPLITDANAISQPQSDGG